MIKTKSCNYRYSHSNLISIYWKNMLLRKGTKRNKSSVLFRCFIKTSPWANKVNHLHKLFSVGIFFHIAYWKNFVWLIDILVLFSLCSFLQYVLLSIHYVRYFIIDCGLLKLTHDRITVSDDDNEKGSFFLSSGYLKE